MNKLKNVSKQGLVWALTSSVMMLASVPVWAAPTTKVQNPAVAGTTDPVTIRKAFKLESDPLTNLVTSPDTSVKSVLRGLAQRVNLNLVFLVDEDDAEDMVLPAMELKDIPVSEAFAFVLKLTNLVGSRMYSSLVITTPDRISELGFTAPVIKHYPIYNDAAASLGGGSGGGGGGEIQAHLEKIFEMRSIIPKPEMLMDKRTSTLIIMGTQEAIDIADELIPVLDRPLPQVMVELKLVELSKQASDELGITYGFSQGKFGASFNLNTQAAAGGGGQQLQGPNATATNPTLLGNPGSGAGSAITFNSLANFAPNFNARLNMLIQNSQARILTSPRLAITHGVQATFDSTTKVPIVSTTATATSTVQTVQSIDIGEKIDVTPFIDLESGYITMKIIPDISTRGQAVSLGEGQASVPESNTRKVETVLRVKDGESVVIGGMMRKTSNEFTSKIPVLGDLPLIGGLFSNTTSAEEEVEIMLIVTPKIMQTE